VAEPVRRVLMTADAVGGVWSYALELARALGPDVRVVLATMGPAPSETQRRDALAIANVELEVGLFRLEWMDDPWDDVARAGDWLLALAERTRPDVVHLNGYVHGALPWRVPLLMMGHSCVLSWWRAVRGCEAPPEWRRYREAVARGLAAARAVVAPTRAMLGSLERDYGPLPPSAVIANARDPSRFVARAKQPFVLAAGRLWDGAKNLAALEAAAPRVSWPVRVAGAAAAEHTPRAVEPLGHLSQAALAGELGRASIYALPARYEPFGLSILEAALAGCALVLGDLPSLRELWSGAATFVPSDDPAALASAIEALIRDPRKRTASAKAAEARAARFSPERMAAGYRALYRRLADARAREAACA